MMEITIKIESQETKEHASQIMIDGVMEQRMLTLNRLQYLVVEEAENCYTIAHMEREGGVSPRLSPLTQAILRDEQNVDPKDQNSGLGHLDKVTSPENWLGSSFRDVSKKIRAQTMESICQSIVPSKPTIKRRSPKISSPEELRNSPHDAVVEHINERLITLGNGMASNDHVALTHTNLHKETEDRIADVLRVEIFRQKIVGVMLCSVIDVISMLVKFDDEGVTVASELVILPVNPDVGGNPPPAPSMSEGKVPPSDHEMEDAENQVPLIERMVRKRSRQGNGASRSEVADVCEKTDPFSPPPAPQNITHLMTVYHINFFS
ncbi:Translation initiation factor IF6 [Artemisia annua]|uniref:Translation initiation factor IF6 n=1 Tax=Artemisia annua TaxID=35608 RepID=A0A2U1PIJ6_ARTAN|nr:Translation initiation factor IF6 [Artemisia annua]